MKLNNNDITEARIENVTDELNSFYEQFKQWTNDIFPALKSLKVEPCLVLLQEQRNVCVTVLNIAFRLNRRTTSLKIKNYVNYLSKFNLNWNVQTHWDKDFQLFIRLFDTLMEPKGGSTMGKLESSSHGDVLCSRLHCNTSTVFTIFKLKYTSYHLIVRKYQTVIQRTDYCYSLASCR